MDLLYMNWYFYWAQFSYFYTTQSVINISPLQYIVLNGHSHYNTITQEIHKTQSAILEPNLRLENIINLEGYCLHLWYCSLTSFSLLSISTNLCLWKAMTLSFCFLWNAAIWEQKTKGNES